MTEQSIVKELAMSIDNRRFPWQLANSFVYSWESDYWTMTSGGETREFEIKISRSDYFVDAKKEKHKATVGANYFYYVCPKDLIKKNEVDKKYGLIYIWDTGFIEIVKKPCKLHNNKFDRWQILANKMYWKFKTLWKEKWIAKEITREDYFAGFNISLEEFETLTHQQ